MKSTKRKIGTLALLLCFLCCFAVRPVLAAEGADSSARVLSRVDSSGEHFAKARSYAAQNSEESTGTAPSAGDTEDSGIARGIPILHIALFAGGLVLSVALLLFMHFSKKRVENRGEELGEDA